MAWLLLLTKGNKKWLIFHSKFPENMAAGSTMEYLMPW
jgi:hypothetical protein